MITMSRAEVLRKCLIVFDALRRVSSKGNAGLEALPGAEESFQADAEICRVLREWLREMEAGKTEIRMPRMSKKDFDEIERMIRNGDFLTPCGRKPETDMPLATDSLEYMLQGNPLMTKETIEAARRMDEAEERLTGKKQPEPNVPVIDMRDWQKRAAQRPPERLDFDEEPLE